MAATDAEAVIGRFSTQDPERVVGRGHRVGDFLDAHEWREPGAPRRWLATADLRVDYFLPITGAEMEIEGEILHKSGRTGHVQVRFSDEAGRLCALAQLTLIEQRGQV